MTDKMTWKEKRTVSWYLIKKVAGFSSSYIPLKSVCTVFQIITPFLVSLLPALILDELIAHESYGRVVFWVGLTVILGGFVSVSDFILNKRLSKEAFTINQKIEMTVNNALENVDFAKLEDPDFKNLCETARNTRNKASGLEHTVNLYFSQVGTIASLVGFLALLIQLVRTDFAITEAHNPTEFLASNGTILLLGAAALGILSTFAQYLMNRVNYKLDKEFIPIDREYSYDGKLARDESYAKDIRFYGLYRIIDAQLKRYCHAEKKLMRKLNRYEIAIAITDNILVGVALCTVYAVVGCKTLAGLISVGEFYLYVSAVWQTVGLVRSFMENQTGIDKCLLYQRAYKEIEETAQTAQDRRGTLPMPQVFQSLEFRHVSFTYPGKEDNAKALSDVSFTIRAGDKTAFVGRNGAGKTTAIKLILRLYTPQEGEILLNGTDISLYDIADYRRWFGVVFQDYKLISATIAENISLAHEFDRDKMEYAIHQAGLTQKISETKNGLNCQLLQRFEQEAVNLSGGEEQKMAIARAIYKNAPMLIMDEPTASLDPFAEKNIYDVICNNIDGKTCIFISHRLSSCRLCNHIILFDHGTIAEEGDHESLLQAEGIYHTLWRAQASNYED